MSFNYLCTRQNINDNIISVIQNTIVYTILSNSTAILNIKH